MTSNEAGDMNNGDNQMSGTETTGDLLSKADTAPGSGGDQKLARAAEAGADDAPSANGDSAAKRLNMGHPDPDSMKMFAGQIPRNMEEAEVRTVFEEFGPVYELSLLKDRATGNSRGCCFVTFFKRKDALEAQNKLHGVRILPTMHNAMQVKPADVENRSERKLFVGMVGKDTEDDAVRSMFMTYGPIEECTVLRDAKKTSKGCAFVTFMSRKNAIAAIRGLHHSRTMDGCSAPLVVKFAEAQRERNAVPGRGPFAPAIGSANRQPIGASYNSSSSSSSWGNRSQQQMQQQNVQQPPPSMNNPMMNNPQALNLLQQLSNAASALSSLAGQGNTQFGMPPPNNMGQQGGFNSQQNQNQNNPASALALMLQAAAMNRPVGGQQFQAPPPANTGGNFNNNNSGGGNFGNAPPNNFGSGGSNFGGQSANNASSFAQPPPLGGNSQSLPLAQPANSNTPLGRQVEGPDGCNLFVYHLPEQCTDADLSNMFSPFGNVISAKVFVDKETNQSKGFGFVSYDNPASAETAIQGMNSFLIGSKRLKVQPKRSAKDLAKPY